MFKKNRISALILCCVFLTAVFGSGLGLIALLEPGPLFPDAPPAAFVTLAVILAAMLFFLSRSPFMMNLSEAEGFGLRGLLRWLVCGVITGIMVTVLTTYLIPLIPMASFFRNLFEIIVSGETVTICYWIVFRKGIPAPDWAKVSTGPASEWELNGSFFLFCGVVFLVGFWYAAFKGLAGMPRLFWLSAGGICVGLASMMIGLVYRSKRKTSVKNPLIWAMLALVGLAFVLFAAGLMI